MFVFTIFIYLIESQLLKRFRLMTSLQTCEIKTRNCCYSNTIVERQSSMIKISGLIPKQVTYRKKLRSSSVILVENPLSGELVLSDFDQSNLRRGYDGKC